MSDKVRLSRLRRGFTVGSVSSVRPGCSALTVILQVPLSGGRKLAWNAPQPPTTGANSTRSVRPD
jgi:hypothetical protein